MTSKICDTTDERSGEERRHLCDQGITVERLKERQKGIDTELGYIRELNSQKFATLDEKIKSLADLFEKNELEQKETIKGIFDRINDLDRNIQKMPVKIIIAMGAISILITGLTSAIVWVITRIPH